MHNKTTLSALLIMSLTFSCGTTTRNQPDSEITTSASSEDIPFVSKPTPSYKPQTAEERNLIRQFSYYTQALEGSNTDQAFLYLYPDLIPYMQKQFNQYGNDVERRLKTYIVSQWQESIEPLKKKGVKFEFLISNILKRVNTRQADLYLCETAINMSRNDTIISDKSHCVAVSFDKGGKWYFLEWSSDAQNILQIKFSQKVISQLSLSK